MASFVARLLLPVLALTALNAIATPIRYRLDPVHTRVLFAIEHAGFSKALGTFSGCNGTVVFDPADWRGARLEVTVPIQRLDLGDAQWNQATLGRNLLDGAHFPEAHFVSTQVEPADGDHARVTGQLTLHGVTRPVTLEVTLNAIKRHPLPPFRQTAGFSATTMLSRADFGITAWKSMIGDHVELRIEAEAIREGRAEANHEADRHENATPVVPTPPPTTETTPCMSCT